MNRRFICALLMAVGCGMPVDTRRPEPQTTKASTKRLTELAVGDSAPPLRLREFVKGEPFASFEAGRVYVVEFSATWCGPCRAAIPHLTELQQQYPEVTFLSVFVRENDRMAPRKLVEEMGDRIGYRVAVDDVPQDAEDGKGMMWRTWMEAIENGGIPEAFVVDGNGRIVAITDPRTLKEPLAEIVAGRWDLNAAMAGFHDHVLANRRRNEFDNRLKAILEPPPSPAVLKNLSDLKAEFPKAKYPAEAASILWAAFRRFSQPDGDDDLALAAAQELLDLQAVEDSQDAADYLNGIAWEFVDPDRTQVASRLPLLFALDAARRADDLAQQSDPQVADTLARALFLLGSPKLAFQAQQRALRLVMSGTDRNQQLVEQLQVRLREYATPSGEN